MCVGGLQVEALLADSGIPARTLESLIRTPRKDLPQNALIQVVDEAEGRATQSPSGLVRRNTLIIGNCGWKPHRSGRLYKIEYKMYHKLLLSTFPT